MIVFFAPGGRLGNLLFQIAAIKSIRKSRERVFCTSLRSAKSLLRGLEGFHNSNRPWVLSVTRRVLDPLLGFALRLGLIGAYLEADGAISRRRGLLPITLIRGYFQDARRAAQWPWTTPRRPFYAGPRSALAQAEGRHPIFLHIRRTDYALIDLGGGRTPMLPYSYYDDALKRFGPLESVHVFVVGDDQEWSREHFSWLPHKTFSGFGPAEDLALMSLCQGGIVSNSSFAWWGARVSAQTLPVIAPLHWMGWPLKVWSPATIQTDEFTYIRVD